MIVKKFILITLLGIVLNSCDSNQKVISNNKLSSTELSNIFIDNNNIGKNIKEIDLLKYTQANITPKINMYYFHEIHIGVDDNGIINYIKGNIYENKYKIFWLFWDSYGYKFNFPQ
jgi:hypothetical protein